MVGAITMHAQRKHSHLIEIKNFLIGKVCGCTYEPSTFFPRSHLTQRNFLTRRYNAQSVHLWLAMASGKRRKLLAFEILKGASVKRSVPLKVGSPRNLPTGGWRIFCSQPKFLFHFFGHTIFCALLGTLFAFMVAHAHMGELRHSFPLFLYRHFAFIPVVDCLWYNNDGSEKHKPNIFILNNSTQRRGKKKVNSAVVNVHTHTQVLSPSNVFNVINSLDCLGSYLCRRGNIGKIIAYGQKKRTWTLFCKDRTMPQSKTLPQENSSW